MFFSCLFSFFKDPGWSGPEVGQGHGALFFFFRFPGRNLLGEGGVTTPCALHTLPAVPILAI